MRALHFLKPLSAPESPVGRPLIHDKGAEARLEAKEIASGPFVLALIASLAGCGTPDAPQLALDLGEYAGEALTADPLAEEWYAIARADQYGATLTGEPAAGPGGLDAFRIDFVAPPDSSIAVAFRCGGDQGVDVTGLARYLFGLEVVAGDKLSGFVEFKDGKASPTVVRVEFAGIDPGHTYLMTIVLERFFAGFDKARFHEVILSLRGTGTVRILGLGKAPTTGP